MIEKKIHCKYCGKKLPESGNAKRTFCGDKCRIYHKREVERGTFKEPKKELIFKPPQPKKERLPSGGLNTEVSSASPQYDAESVDTQIDKPPMYKNDSPKEKNTSTNPRFDLRKRKLGF